MSLSNLFATINDKDLLAIAKKVENNERISIEDGIILYEKGALGFVSSLANYIREKKHGLNTYFNRNFQKRDSADCKKITKKRVY